MLGWSLMTRTSNTMNIFFNHLSWGGDCFRVTIDSHKSNRNGNNQSSHYESNMKHVYANPLNPSICPFLSLGILIVCNSGYSGKLFSNDHTNVSFSNWIVKLGETLTSEEKGSIGIDLDRIGSHSVRKGGTSYAASTDMTALMALFLRGGWGFGTVLPIYVQALEGGDCCVGRVLSGLNTASFDIALLPPRFMLNSNINYSDFIHEYSSYDNDAKQVI